MSNEINKHIALKAPLARVWRALTDYQEFGTWFGVHIEAPFALGQTARGKITHPGFEHVTWQVRITAIEPQALFAFTWHPYAVDPDADYSHETPTLVEFRLQARDGGTLLHVRESGFDHVPEARRAEAFRMNEGGWAAQMDRVARHVDAAA